MKKIIYLAIIVFILASCNNKVVDVQYGEPCDSIYESNALEKIGNADALALLKELKDAGCNEQKMIASFYFNTQVESEVYLVCPHNVKAPDKLVDVYNSNDGEQKAKAKNALAKADSIMNATKTTFDKSYAIILKYLDKLNASAEASYRYEYHKGGKDTILAAVSFDTIPNEVDEAIRIANNGDYSRLHGYTSDLLAVKIQKGPKEDLMSVKYSRFPKEDDMRSIVPHDADTSAIDDIIMNAISMYDVKSVDVCFRFDSTFYSDNKDVIMVRGYDRIHEKEKKAAGRHYFVPLTENERQALTSKLQSRLADYCHTHRHSDFCLDQFSIREYGIFSRPIFSISATYFDGGMEPLSLEDDMDYEKSQAYIKRNGPRMRTYYWTTQLTQKGLHLLRLTAGPNLYIPNKWTEVKKCHNDKKEWYNFEFEFPKVSSLDDVLLLIDGKVVTAKQMEQYVPKEGTVVKVVNRENVLPLVKGLNFDKFTYDDKEYEYSRAMEYKEKYGEKAMNGVIDVENYKVLKKASK